MRLLLISVVYILVLVPGISSPLVSPLSSALLMYIKTLAFPVFIGLLLGGVISWLIPNEYISVLLAQKKKRTIFYAVISGFLMTACSHGILAISIQLYKKGASVPAVVAFLLASPWANLPLTILMFGFFGYKAFFIVLAAVLVAIVTGFVYMLLDNRNLIESNPNTVAVEESFSVIKDALERIRKVHLDPRSIFNGIKLIILGGIDLADMVLWWIMLGALFASIAAAYVPPDFMHHYMGPTFLGLAATLFLATVIEICSEGSAPLAFEIFRQTGALGNSFVFLMAGVSTDYTEIGLLWTNIGWKTALFLPIITVPQILILGVLANIFIR